MKHPMGRITRQASRGRAPIVALCTLCRAAKGAEIREGVDAEVRERAGPWKDGRETHDITRFRIQGLGGGRLRPAPEKTKGAVDAGALRNFLTG